MTYFDFSHVTISFAIRFHPPGLMSTLASNCLDRELLLASCRFRDPTDLRQDFLFSEDQIFLVIDRDVAAGVFAEQNPVARLYVERDSLTLLDLASTNGHHFAFLRLLFGRVRNDDATLRSLLLFQSPYQNAVV